MRVVLFVACVFPNPRPQINFLKGFGFHAQAALLLTNNSQIHKRTLEA
jgi:hypothetical protein